MELDASQWIAIGSVGTLIMAMVIAITLIIQVRQTNILNNQTLVSNFSVLTNYTGDPETRKNRGVLYKFYESKLMERLCQDYPHIEYDKKLGILKGAIKQIGAMYERVGFLLEENKRLRWKFIEYHGFTMGIMWDIFKPFNILNKEKDKAKGYTYFEKIGNDSYNRWYPEIKEFLDEKRKQNQNRKDSEIEES